MEGGSWRYSVLERERERDTKLPLCESVCGELVGGWSFVVEMLECPPPPPQTLAATLPALGNFSLPPSPSPHRDLPRVESSIFSQFNFPPTTAAASATITTATFFQGGGGGGAPFAFVT